MRVFARNTRATTVTEFTTHIRMIGRILKTNSLRSLAHDDALTWAHADPVSRLDYRSAARPSPVKEFG
jgi:hypothetical protein